MKTLRLNDTKIDDGAVPILLPLSGLNELDLSYSAITDAALGDLKQMKNLERMTLLDTAISAEGAKQLKEALPNCEILWQPASNLNPAGSSSTIRP